MLPMSMTGYNARLTINGKEIPLAKVAMTLVVDPTLEAAASALRADLAARGIPADELPEAVMLALAVQQERINQLHTICRALHDRLERVENAAAPLLARTPTDSRPGFRVCQVIDEALSRAQSDPATYQPNPDGRYPLCLPRIGQADVCQRCGETIDPDIERPCPWVPREGRWGPSVPGAEAPRFRHGCSDCTFLGRSEDGGADLYCCRRPPAGQLVARHGDQINAICSTNPGTAMSLMDLYPHLAEAHRRAVARGLVGGAGEGGERA
jgi:hypothetical protein